MEIQSFLLCGEVQHVAHSSIYHAQMIGIHSFHSLDGTYPLRLSSPYYLLLRREQRLGDEQFTVRFDLVDQDGRTAGEPRGHKYLGLFPAGARFYTLHGMVDLVLPAIGDYRLDIVADEESHGSVFPYNIEVTPPPKG